MNGEGFAFACWVFWVVDMDYDEHGWQCAECRAWWHEYQNSTL